jgi:hypothetical protein
MKTKAAKIKDSHIYKRINQVEKSLQRLHNTAWVIGIVAGVFGIGSTFGYSAFSNANNKLKKLEANIDSIDKTVAKNMALQEQQAIKNLQLASTQLFKRFSQWGPAKPQNEAEKDVIFDGQSGRSAVFYCPTGHYVVGMQVIDHDNGETCTSCINGVRFICRPINY